MQLFVEGSIYTFIYRGHYLGISSICTGQYRHRSFLQTVGLLQLSIDISIYIVAIHISVEGSI